jgi:hypothetical protein
MNSISYLRIKNGLMKLLSWGRIIALCFPISLSAQNAPNPRTSPLAIVSTHYKNTYLKITYSQPLKNNREIFGKLVPYDQVWRTGANEATEITITNDIFVNGISLKAGTYSFFTIPGMEKWTIIFNNDLGLWGSYNYNPKMDAVRFDVPIKSIPENVIFEPFTIRIDQKTDTAELFLLWDNVQVSFPIQFNEPKP